MKSWVAMILAVLLGAAAGWGGTRFEFAGVTERFSLDTLSPRDDGHTATHDHSDGATHDHAHHDHPSGSTVDRGPRAVPLEPEFNFGAREKNSTVRHKFRVKNAGQAPLTLYEPSVSCGVCVHPKYSGGVVPPGETVEIEVHFELRKPGPQFNEHIELKTSDPRTPRITLKASGTILNAVSLEPTELTWGSIPVSEPRDQTFQLLSFLADNVQITEHAFSDSTTASFFSVEFEVLSAEELSQHEFAKSGLRGKVAIKPGLPLGTINQTLRLKTSADPNSEFDLPLRGTVVSDVSVIGTGGVNFSGNVLSLGAVKRREGAKVMLQILIKGPLRDQVEVKLGNISPPDELRATLGQAKRQGGGAVVLIPLTIEIPPDLPVVNRMGSPEVPAAQVFVETTHPDAKRFPIKVRFFTQD